MTERDENILQMLISVREFDGVNANDYKAFADAAAQFMIVRSAIDALEGYAAAQTSGASSRAVDRKSVIAAAIRRKLKDIARTARALNFDDEGFRRLFIVPEDNSEQKVLAFARESATEAAKYKADFLRLAMRESFVDDLLADITAYETAINEKSGAQDSSVGATAGIDAEIKRAMEAAIILDAIMKNVYTDNPVKLAEWTRARHVRRTGQRNKETPTNGGQ
jgi:hypothetical protein